MLKAGILVGSCILYILVRGFIIYPKPGFIGIASLLSMCLAPGLVLSPGDTSGACPGCLHLSITVCLAGWLNYISLYIFLDGSIH